MTATRATVLFAGATLPLVAIAAWVMSLVFRAPVEQRAIWISAAVAFATQLVAFSIARQSVGRNVVAGWGLGMLLRVVVLAVYALVIIGAFALPSGAALVSLAMFFFLSTLLEPLLLKP
jgi:hypothetical protein